MSGAVRALALGLALLVLLFDARASAHGADPVGVSIIERGSEVEVRIDAPASIAEGLAVEMPEDCVRHRTSVTRADRARRARELVFQCAAPLAGRTVGVVGLADAVTAIVRVESTDGAVQREVVQASAPHVTVAHRPSRGATLLAFGELGVRHLLTGLDHVLFIAGLVLLAQRGRATVAALTAFTIGHSATLLASVTHVVRIPAPLAEVAIAASLVLLGLRVVQGAASRRGPEPPLRLALVAGAMGLLHGLGFAYALEEVGIPEGEIPLSLFGFNVGVELGQLAVVALLLLAAGAWSRVRPFVGRLPRVGAVRPDGRLVAGYALGGCAAMWCIERVVAL